MYFVDSTGHTFYQMSFKYDPIGFEFYQNKYTFWVDNKDHSYCSINNYYIRPIYILLDHKAEELEIIADSQVFTLISSTTVAENFTESIRQLELDEEEFIYFDEENNKSTKSDLHLDAERNDILELEVLSSDGSDEPITKYMYPFYVIANSPVPGTFFTNILIYAKYVDSTDTEQEEWCPITVGGEFNEENEILYINGLNMGVRLPHEIIRSVYNASYNNDVFDEDLYNEKLKEYLIEYMSIRGEIGNYRSAINSLKWFGWGNKVELVSLLKTDNQFMTQFIRDYFDTNSDIIESFKHFINSTLLSLVIWENKETGEYDKYDLNADFMGENQPLLEDLFNKTIPVLYGGVGEETYYYKTYYNFIFGELLFKISALKYYYEKYFLPVHLSIHNASLHHKVYTNDIKMLNRSSMNIAEPIIKMGLWKDNFVEFPKDNEIWLTEQIHIIDKQYNEWNLEDIIKESEKYDYYYLHDTCGNIPIKFINYENEPQLHVHMIFEKLTSDNDNILYINNKINLFTDSIEVYDVTKRKIDINNTFISYSRDNGKTYSPFFLGLNTVNDILETYNKKEFDIKNNENGHYIEINNEKIYLSDEEQTLYFGDGDNQYYIIVPSLDKVNIDLFNNLGDCIVTYHKDVLLRLRIENDRIYKCNIIKNDVITDITDDITIMYSPTSEVFYESDFIFNPNDADKYLSFVLYPKMFNNSPTDIIYNRYGENLTNKKIDITYFINNRFRLRMLVNNKWHDYEFVVKMPDIQIEFGKLIYKYYDDELKFYTRFNQLNELTDTTLRFNAFMHEPRMTRINHVNFMEDFLKYLKISNARYIDGNMIPTNEFYYYIDVNFIEDGIEYKQRIYITNNDYGNDLIIPRKYFNYDMIYYLFLDGNMLYIFGEERINNIYDVIAIEGSALIYDNDFDDFNNNHDNANFYIDVNNYKRFRYNNETNQYETDTSRGVVSFNINESLRSDFNTFTSKYIETHSITNNYKYLNQIHVYDLYRLNAHEGNNLIALQNNIDLMYHGIRFTHKSFLSENTISIVGNTNNLITNSDERINNNKSFLSDLYESDDKTSYSYYSNYINTYDDLVIYSAYEGDWLRPLGTVEDDDVIEPTGYVYYEKVDRNGTPMGQYTTESINVVTDNIMTYFDSDYTEEYKDFEKLEDFQSWLYDDNITYVKNDTEYHILHNAIHNNKLYIERNNVDDTTTQLYYTVELVEQHKISKEEKIINPTYSEYKNIIEESLINGPERTNYEFLYKLRIKTFIESHRLVSNIQRIYEGDAECVNDVYSVNINGTTINLLPFYAEYDGNHDVLFNVKSLIQQPGIDWIDINDIDETIYDLTDLDMDDDYIELTDINNDITDEDIRSLLNHRKILILNITSRLLNSVHAYEETMSFKDYVLNIKDNDINTNTIPLTFKINNNVIDTDDNVTIKTVIRCRYKNKNDIYEYDFYDNVLNINTLLINENDEYHINCSSGEDNYITHVMESGEEIMYDNFTVFFVLIPNTTETDTEFAITFNPRITLVYNDYDILEYPNDSFDSSLNYNGNNYVTYKINDTVYKYGDCREVKSVVDLYNEFFDSKTVVFNSDYQFTNIECNDQLNIDKNNVEYDMYLMHNTKDWYILYISKDTCDKTLALYDYEPSKKEIIFITDNHQYKLIHNSSTKKFLINRYVYSSANGKNHFNVNDIIVGKVLNNERLPIDIFKTQKWEMTPISIDVNKKLTTSTSNIDMCIFDAPTYNNEYVKGYYDVIYRYTLDRISTQQYKKYGTIRIG